jgi:cephalosporin hydroxylase
MKTRPLIFLCLVAILSLMPVACRRKQPAPKAAHQDAAPPAPQPAASKTEASKTEASKTEPMVFDIRIVDPAYKDRLLGGFYDGTEGWKWTSRRFAVSLDALPPLDVNTFLVLDCTVPDELMQVVHEVTVTARVNGQKVGSKKYTKPGRYFLQFNIQPALLKQSPAKVEFELDHTFQEEGTGRELGLIAVSVSLSHPDETILNRDTATQLARQGYLQMLKQRRLQMPIAKQNELMKLFHDLPVWAFMWFENVPIEKNPLDLWMMQQIIYETRPDFVIETGTFKGGSALYWAYTLNGMGLENSRVFTIDVQDLTATAAVNPLWKKYVTFYKGSSTAPEIVRDIAGRVKGRKVLVTLDSDHTATHVINEMRAYAPMINPGSYLVVEDTHMDGIPTEKDFGPGPMTAVLQFLKEGGTKDFEQDFSREALVMTFNPGGWLRRK